MRFASLVAAAAAAVPLAACMPHADLEPAPAADPVAGIEEAAKASVAGVAMVVQAGAWPGAAPVEREVTPLEVRIVNNSGRPLKVGYDAFALVSADGERYDALPPYRIEGEVAATDPAVGAVEEPAFDYDRFEVAPVYTPAYPGITPFMGPFYVDPLFYDNYWGYWEQTELPTEEMLARAIPEGVIQPGGSVQGFLYFEDVPAEVSRVQYRAELVNARTGDMFGTVTIPFVVQEGEG